MCVKTEFVIQLVRLTIQQPKDLLTGLYTHSFDERSGSTQAKLEGFLLTYRNTPHCTTTETPAVLMMRTPLELVKPNMRRTVDNRQAKQHSGDGVTRQLQVGPPVFVGEHRKNQTLAPGVVNTRNVPLSYQVTVAPDTIWKRHVDQITESQVLTTLEFPSTSAACPDVCVCVLTSLY